jgi:formylmethanofuran dehydrogenase subunit C
MTRGPNGGHVGVVSGIHPSGNPIIISGNHNRRVGVGIYPRGRIYAYVVPRPK